MPRMLSLQLQKSPTPDFEEKCGNSPDISKGISQSGMCKFESSQVSQPVTASEELAVWMAERPTIGGFCDLVGRLQNSRVYRIRRQLCGKSPPATADIPVFGRLSLETRFDPRWVRAAGVDFVHFSGRQSLDRET